MDYHKRLVYGKLVDKTLSDVDYTELSGKVYGQEYSSDVARRMMYGSKKTLDLLDNELVEKCSDSEVLSKMEEQTIELKKERQKVRDQRTAFNKLIRERSRQEELNELLQASLANAISEGDLQELNYDPSEQDRFYSKNGNDLMVSLSDIHYGAKIDNFWNKYDTEVCACRMKRYLNRIIEVAKIHGSENCVVWANGDEINGNIHYSLAVTNQEHVINQVKGVSELISEFLEVLSRYFKNVTYVSVAGNHSRINPDKNKCLAGERLDDLIEWYLSARLSNIPNVTISMDNRIDDTMYLIDVRGRLYCGVHGDYEYGDNSIQSLKAMADRPIYAVLMGHKHHNKIDTIQGVKSVMAGSFMGMDEYCVQKRLIGRAEQLILVCDYSGIQCYYDVNLQ